MKTEKADKSSSAGTAAEHSTKADNSSVSQPIAKLNVMCRLFGHKVADLDDSGYPVCLRCGCHSYYDAGVFTNDWNKAGVLMHPIWFIQRKLYQLKYDIKHWYRRVFLGDKLPF